ncbi:hypothetical protein ACE1SV_58390 [Streptomyces sennicomposti]
MSAGTVGGLLHEEGFSLQAGSETTEGKQHPDRDAQLRYINERAGRHIDAGQPVISVDTKKKEAVGDCKRTPAASGGRPVSRYWSGRTTSWTGRDLAGRSRTGSMASLRTPAGSVSASITTPPRSQSPLSAAGGSRGAGTTIRPPAAC